MTILTGVRGYFTVVLIYVSLKISHTEHFSCATCKSSLEKCLFRFSAYFLAGLFVSLILSYISYFYIFHDSTLLVTLFEDTFSPSVGSLFIKKKIVFLCYVKAFKFD